MSKNKNKIKVLFLCTGNACRSQIAEGWARHLKGNVIDAYSAGIIPVGLSRRAAEVMAEAGVDISAQTSKHVDELKGIDFDYVVTVCDYARESCPVFPRKTKLFHKNFEDPTFMIGTEQQIKAAFIKLRDQMKEFVEKMPEILENESPDPK
jgi:arsenate reductase